jgi:hypothetical protein
MIAPAAIPPSPHSASSCITLSRLPP